MNFHEDPLLTERVITNYILRTLDADTAEMFESHYLGCDHCFDDLRASELLIAGLRPSLDQKIVHGVTVCQFLGSARLIRDSAELRELSSIILQQKDTKVLIDLSKVSRIDSVGLGMLMQCYTHAVNNSGMLKLLNPSVQVERVLKLTRIDSILEMHSDPSEAIRSFA